MCIIFPFSLLPFCVGIHDGILYTAAIDVCGVEHVVLGSGLVLFCAGIGITAAAPLAGGLKEVIVY